MSKADEMFKELGYEKIRNNEKEILYKKEYKSKANFIAFDFYTKTMLCEYADEDYEFNGALNINMQELQAINEKCKELNWL